MKKNNINRYNNINNSKKSTNKTKISDNNNNKKNIIKKGKIKLKSILLMLIKE